jgi:hypothetical protein
MLPLYSIANQTKYIEKGEILGNHMLHKFKKRSGERGIPRKHEEQYNYMKIADSVSLSLYMRDNDKVQQGKSTNN